MLIQSLRQLKDELQARMQGRWVQTPTRLRWKHRMWCRAGIILQHYGRYVPLTQLRERCGVSRDGSDAANLILAAQSYGLNGRGFKKGIKALEKITPPAILFWEFNHFLVFEGFIGDKIALNDPALGPRKVSLSDFETSYTGIVLTLTPGEDFIQDGQAPTVWPIVWRRLFTEPGGALFILLSGLMLILPQLVMPIFSQIYIDEVIGNGMENWLKPMLWAMALTISLQALLQYLQLSALNSGTRLASVAVSLSIRCWLPEPSTASYYQTSPSHAANANIAEFIGSV